MQILVVILSVFLALFLLLAIVLTIMLIKITKQIRSVTDSAKRTVDRVEGFAANISTATSAAAMGRVVKAFVSNFKK